jgi:hypothetical protein
MTASKKEETLAFNTITEMRLPSLSPKMRRRLGCRLALLINTGSFSESSVRN